MRGRAPLLVSRKALKTLQASIDFVGDQLHLFGGQVKVPLSTNSAGQYIVSLLNPGQGDASPAITEEIMISEAKSDTVQEFAEKEAELPAQELPKKEEKSLGQSSEPLHVWTREDSFLSQAITTGKHGPPWRSVQRRIIRDRDSSQVLFNEIIDHSQKKSRYHQVIPKHVMHIQSEFHFESQDQVIRPCHECLSSHHMRQLHSQVRKQIDQVEKHAQGTKSLLVAEVFSPPRFAKAVEGQGFRAVSYDIRTSGHDFTRKSTRLQVAQELREDPPELLVVCPPCTDEGGWFSFEL